MVCGDGACGQTACGDRRLPSGWPRSRCCPRCCRFAGALAAEAGAAMKARGVVHGFAVVMLAVVSSVSCAQSPKPSPHHGATLRVGLWTLWHDKEMTVSSAPESTATFRICEGCEAVKITRA